LIGHCVSPQPWREIDAHDNTAKLFTDISYLSPQSPHYQMSCKRTVFGQICSSYNYGQSQTLWLLLRQLLSPLHTYIFC